MVHTLAGRKLPPSAGRLCSLPAPNPMNTTSRRCSEVPGPTAVETSPAAYCFRQRRTTWLGT